MNPCPKVITGTLHVENKTASDWGYQGFIAYGCHGYTVVIDPVTLQVIQTLGPHSGFVTHVRWSSENYHHAFATGSTYNLYLATADGAGNIVIWDVVSGQQRTELFDNQPSKPILGLEWYTGNDESHELLMVLRSPDCLELWDTYSGVRLWRKSFGEQLITFALDPFDIQQIVLLCESPNLIVLNDISVIREPSDGYRYVRILDPQPTISASGKYSTGSLTRNSSSSLTKMASLATNMLTGPEQIKKGSRQSSMTEDEQDLLTSCRQVVFNPAHKHMVLLVFATEIHVIDLDVDLAISTMRLDRSSPNFTKVIPCSDTDMLFCLHENGSVSVRVRKQSNNSEKFQKKDITMDLTYDLVCQSDPLRLLHHSKVFSMVYNPVSERQIALILSDSRVIFLDLLSTEYTKPEDSCLLNNRPKLSLADMIGRSIVVPSGGGKSYLKRVITLRLVMSGLVSGIISPIVALETVPTVGDLHAKGNLVAVGSGFGTIQLVNVYSGQVENEFKLFMSPVRGLLWISYCFLIAFTYSEPSSYGNRGVKSDIVILNIISGKIHTLLEGNDKKGPIVMVKVSPSRLYCVIVFKHGRMELWNIKSRQLVREMVIEELIRPSDVEWYPYVGGFYKEKIIRDNNGKERKLKRRVLSEQLFVCGQIDGGCPFMRLNLEDGIMSGATCFNNDILYNGLNHKAEVIKIAWKKKIAILADKVGQLFYVDCSTKRNEARKLLDRHGSKVEEILFAPGKDNLIFLVKYSNIVDVWEISNDKPELLTSSPPLPSNLIHVCWAGPESIVMATDESCLHVLDISHIPPTSPVEKNKDDFVYVKNAVMKCKNSPISQWKLSGIFSATIMERKQAFLLKYSLQCNIQPFTDVISQYCCHIDSATLKYLQDESTGTAERCYQVARLFGDRFDMEFWRMVKYASQGAKSDKVKLKDINKPLDLIEICSNLPTPTSQTSDLISLDLSSDLEISSHSDTPRSDGDMDFSWLDSVEQDDGNIGLITSLGDMMKCCHYKVYETARLDLHNKRRCDYRVKHVCSSRYILTGRVDMAVQVLMETDTDNMEFKADYLKACLSSCTTQHTGTSLSTVKLAATHLIAAGELSDGVDLLCLIGKHLDACKYLISYGKWQEAVWLAKTNLNEKDCLDVIYKWADYLWNKSQKTKAMLLMLSHNQFATVLHMLCSQRQFDTAALFLQSCLEKGLLQRSEYTDSVFVEFSKLLTVTEYHSAVKHYCQLAGEKGDSFIEDLCKK